MARTLLLALVVAATACSNDAPTSTPAPAPKPEPAPSAAAPAAAPVDAPSLSLQLDYTSAEHSKDSHSNRYRCTIDGTRMTYHGPYGECLRGQCEHQEVTLELTGADLTALVDAVRDAALPATFEETKPANQTGNSAELHLTVATDDHRHELVIEGMTSAWHPDRKDSELSDQAKQWLSAVESLRQQLRDLARRELPTAH